MSDTIAEMQATSDQHRQKTAGFAQQLTLAMLRQLHEKNTRDGTVGVNPNPGGGADVTPIIQGMVGGMVEFLIRGGISDEAITEMIEQTVAELKPQARMAVEAEAMGAVGEGRA